MILAQIHSDLSQLLSEIIMSSGILIYDEDYTIKNKEEEGPLIKGINIEKLNKMAIFRNFFLALERHMSKFELAEHRTMLDIQEDLELIQGVWNFHCLAQVCDFLIKNKYISSTEHFLAIMFEIWLEPYRKSTDLNCPSSCSFVNVFIPECFIEKHQIVCINSFYRFYLLESCRKISNIKIIDKAIIGGKIPAISCEMTFGNIKKPTASFLCGIDPIAEMVIYTLIYLVKKDTSTIFIKINKESLAINIQVSGRELISGYIVHKPSVTI